MVFTPRFRGRDKARGGGVGGVSFAPKGPGPQQFNDQNVNKSNDGNSGGFSGAKNDAPASSAESLRITVGNEIFRERQQYQQHGPVTERLGPPVVHSASQGHGDMSRISQYGSGRGVYPSDQYRPPDRGPDTDRYWDHDREQLDREFRSRDYGHGKDKHGDFSRPEGISVERADSQDFREGGTAQGFNLAPTQSAGQRYSGNMPLGGSMSSSATELQSITAQQRPLKSILKKVTDSGLQPLMQSQPPTQTQHVPNVSTVPDDPHVTSLPEVNRNYPGLPGISNYMDPDDEEKFLSGDGPPGSNFAHKTANTSAVYQSVSSFVSQQRSLSDKLTVNPSNLSMSNLSSTSTVSGLGAGVSYGSGQALPSMVSNRGFGQGPWEKAGGNFGASNQLSGSSFNAGLSNIGQSQRPLFPVQNQTQLQTQQSQAASLQEVGGGSGGEGSDFWGLLAMSLQSVKEAQTNQGQGQMSAIQTGSTAPAVPTSMQGTFPQPVNQGGMNTTSMYGNQTKSASQPSLFPSGIKRQVSNTQEQAATSSQLPQTAAVVAAESKEDYDPTIENILKSIGFDFDMSKRMQEKAKHNKSADVIKLEETQFGINQTASFLGSTDLSPAEMKSQLFDRERGQNDQQSSLKEPGDSKRYADDDVEKMIREAQETVRLAKKDFGSREMSALKYINEASPIPRKDSLSPRSDRSREIQKRKIMESDSKGYDSRLPDKYEKINSPDRFGGGLENDTRPRYDSSSQNRFSPRRSPEKWSPRQSRSIERRETQGQHKYSRSPDGSSKRSIIAGRRSVSNERQSRSAGRGSWSRSPLRKRSRSGSRGRWPHSRSFDRHSHSRSLGRQSRSRSRGRQSWSRSPRQRSRSRSFGRRSRSRSRSRGRLSWSRSRSRSHSRSRRLSPEKQKDTIFESQPLQSYQPYQGDNPPQCAYIYPNTSQPYEYGPPLPISQPYGPSPFGPGYGPPPPGYGPPPPGYGPPPGVPGFGPPPIGLGYGPPHSGKGFQGPPPGFGSPPPGVPGYGPPPGYIPNTYSKASHKASGESAPSRTLLYPPVEDKDTSLKKESHSLSLDKLRSSKDMDRKSPSKERSSKDSDVLKTKHSSKDKLPKKEESSLIPNRTVLPPKSEYHRTVVIGGPRVKKDDEKTKDFTSETKQNSASRKISRPISKDSTAGNGFKSAAKVNSGSKSSKTAGAIDKEQQKELDGKQKLLAALQKELERLKKQQNELMRQKRRQKDGHKDPVLLQNSQLQEEIMKQIEKIKSKMPSSQGVSSVREVKKEADSNKKEADSNKKEVDSNKKEADSNKKEEHSTEAKNEKDIKVAEKDDQKPVLEFYDGGNHWCKLCSEICSNLVEYFQHLRTQKHLQKTNNFDRPWVPDSLKNPKKKLMTLKSALTPIAGVEFMMAADAFYCSLCREFAGDVNCTEAHLESETHYKNYQKHCDENPLYEKRLMLDKATAISMKKAEESKKRKLESSAKEDIEKKPKLENESDSTEKVTKVEEIVKSDIEMKRAGFGKFKWEKQDSNSSEKNEVEMEEEEVQLTAPPPGVAQAQKGKGKISINLQFKGGIKASPPVATKTSALPPWQPVSKKSELKASPAPKPVEIFPLRKKADTEPAPLDMFLSVEGTESKVPVIETKKKISAKEILEAFTGKYKEKVEKAAENATESKDQRSDSQSNIAESEEDQSKDSEEKSGTTMTMTLSSKEEEADMILMGIDPKSSEPLAAIKPPPPVSQNMNLPIKDSRASSSAKEMYDIFFEDEAKQSGDGKVEVSVEFKLFDINEPFLPTSSQKKPQGTSEKLGGKVQTESVVTGFSLEDVPLPAGDGPSHDSEQGTKGDNSAEKRRDDTTSLQADVNLASEVSNNQTDIETTAEKEGKQNSVIKEGKTDEKQGMGEPVNITQSAVSAKDRSMSDGEAKSIDNVDNDNDKSKEAVGNSKKSIQNETSMVEAKEVPITAVKPESAANQTAPESAGKTKPVEKSAQVKSAPHGVQKQGAEADIAKQTEVKHKSSGPIEKEVDAKKMTTSQTTEKSAIESKQDQKPVIPSKRTAKDENNTADTPSKQSKVTERTPTQTKGTEDKQTVQTKSTKKPTPQSKGKQKQATESKVPQAAVETPEVSRSEVKPSKPEDKPSPAKTGSSATMSLGTNTRLKRAATNKGTPQIEPVRTTRASTRATRSSTRLAQAAQKTRSEDSSMDESQTNVDRDAAEEQDVRTINDAKSVSPSVAQKVGNKDITSATSVSDKKDASIKSVDEHILSPEKAGQTESDNMTESEDREAVLHDTIDDASSDCSGISMQLGSDFEVLDECED